MPRKTPAEHRTLIVLPAIRRLTGITGLPTTTGLTKRHQEGYFGHQLGIMRVRITRRMADNFVMTRRISELLVPDGTPARKRRSK